MRVTLSENKLSGAVYEHLSNFQPSVRNLEVCRLLEKAFRSENPELFENSELLSENKWVLHKSKGNLKCLD